MSELFGFRVFASEARAKIVSSQTSQRSKVDLLYHIYQTNRYHTTNHTHSIMKVLLCGGGNAIHVLTAYVSSLDDCQASILSLFPGEAERLSSNITDQGIRCMNDLGPDRFGKPAQCSDDPAIAADADVVILALPSFTHEMYLQKLKPYLKVRVCLVP